MKTRTSKITTLFLFITLAMLLKSVQVPSQTLAENHKMQWWSESRFGLFIHWGLYSKTAGYWNGKVTKGGEHFMWYERIPLNVYARIADDFNPVKFNADEWVSLAKNAGMKYLVITSKHHDGFAMYDSKVNDYNIVKRSPFGRDPMKELVEACRKQELKFGFYYSLGRDWESPDVPSSAGYKNNSWDFPDENTKVFNTYFERKLKPQIKELVSQYGPIDIIWFDTPERISKAESQELRDIILAANPKCIINSRIFNGPGMGDYQVTEQEIVKKIKLEPWEACVTMSRNWGYNTLDSAYKTPELLIRLLLEISSKGGNLLLNIGPTGEGEITNQTKERLSLIGKWMKRNAEGIYGTGSWITDCELLADTSSIKKEVQVITPNTMKDAVNDATSKAIIPLVRFTTKGDDLYVFVCSWHEKKVLIKSLASNKCKIIKEISLLGDTKNVKWEQSDNGLALKMPSSFLKEIPVVGFKIRFQNY